MKLSRDLLPDDVVTARLGQGWTLQDKKLHKRFEFDDFVSAFGWMAQVALEAEKLDHHPNWSNVYRTVEVTLWTHDAGGVTEYDFELAERMDRHASRGRA